MLTHRSSVVLLFTLSVVVHVCSQRRFVHVPLQKSWLEAQKYCREHHTDLATFREEEDELQNIKSACATHSWYYCWIGLYQNRNGVWSWSEEENLNATSRSLAITKCMFVSGGFWYTASCHLQMSFLCFETPILVREMKTWEEALEHCMSLHAEPGSSSNHLESLYTLATLNIATRNPEASEAALAAETEEVWVGLRFLAGRWLWVNGKPVNAELPVCPQPGSYCGVMTTSGDLRPENDCSERRNFLCSRRNYST